MLQQSTMKAINVNPLGVAAAMSYIDGLVQDCSTSIANALESLQYYTKPSMWTR